MSTWHGTADLNGRLQKRKQGPAGLRGEAVLQTSPAGLMQALRQWVQDEYQDKQQKSVDTSSWPIRYLSCLLVMQTWVQV